MLAALASPPATKALDPDPFPRHSLRHAVYAALLHFGFETANHYIYTDHAQVLTGSAGMSYLWMGTRFSTDLIYGSGLRSGFANTDHLPPYAQVNMGLSREVKLPDWQPMTLRFDVVNVFDTIYAIRDGSGIGVFAPQYGPRRAFFVGLSQKFGYGADKPNAAADSFAGVFDAASRAKPQDSLYVKPPFGAPWTWAGFYLGAHAGYNRGLSKNSFAVHRNDRNCSVWW